MKHLLINIFCLFLVTTSFGQKLKPNFDIDEYCECVCMASHFRLMTGLDSIYYSPKPQQYRRIYSSPVVGFDNMWELWQSTDNIIAISIRGSVTTMKSWMSNFHAGMVAANGEFILNKKYNYSLCDNQLASVHVGWLGGMLSMSEDIISHIDSCYLAGNRDFIITGHSQGGGICFILTAYLYTLQSQGKLPQDIRFKTYCSAAPKPGDYAFACEYEYMTRGGWAYNVINPDDWVPEVPLSVQTMKDFRPTNPFSRLNQLTDTLRAIDRFKIKFLFNKLGKPLKKSEKLLRKYLGSIIGKMLIKEEPSYSIPKFRKCANYARTGVTIILKTDPKYHELHPLIANDIFEHHSFKAYYDLLELNKNGVY